MADEIEKVIYKLELDGSAYIAGVEALSNSTKKLTAEQERTNKALQDSQDALKAQSVLFQKAKVDLDTYNGTDTKYRIAVIKSYIDARNENNNLIDSVNKSRAAFDAANRAAQDLADTTARANNLQPVQGQGKVDVSTAALTQGPAITSQIAGVLNIPEFAKQAQIIQQTKDEFDDLRISIGLADARMKQLNTTDEEFKLLAPIVAQGKEALAQYDEAAKGAAGSTVNLQTQIRNNTNELIRMVAAGQEATDEYKLLRIETARLVELQREQRQALRFLSSETKAIDFGKSAVQAAISGFEVYTSISILAGGASEELQKKTLQLFAAMQLLTALDQLAISVKKGSILATGAQSAAQAVYTEVVGASTGALKAFKLALLGTGIGVAIVLIGYLVSKYLEYRDAIKEAGEKQKLLNQIFEDASKTYGSSVAKIDILKAKLDDLSIPEKERLAIAKEYNKIADEGNQIDLKQIDNLGLINTAIERQIKLLRDRAISAAADNVLSVKAQAVFLAQQKVDEDAATRKIIIDPTGHGGINRDAAKLQEAKAGLATKQAVDELNKAQADFNKTLATAAELTTTQSLTTPDKKAKKELEDDFEKRKAEFTAAISALAESEFESEITIRAKFKDKLDKALLSIKDDKTIPKTKKGNEERVILISLATKLNTGELNKNLEELHKKILDAQQKLNDELTNLKNKNDLDRINLIEDDFTRQRSIIDFNEQKELATAKENTQKRLDNLDSEKRKGLVSEEIYQQDKNQFITDGEQQTLNIIQKAAQERHKLSFKAFEQLKEDADRLLNAGNLGISEAELINTQNEIERFKTGKISYEQLEKELTDIHKFGINERYQLDVIDLKEQIGLKQKLLDTGIGVEGKLTADERKKLQDEIAALRKQLADKGIQNAQDNIDKPETKKKRDSVAAYAEAIGQVADSVIGFWQAANEAESRALDRSIALQERRVDAAQRIADRGNAQYLKAEEDRLTELNVKRENAARKQLGIDAALQASQILVGITGAISKIATGIGAAETIAEIAIIIGALATGYGIVKSLQGNQPKLAKGTTELKRNGQPAGIDTIPAWLNEGEAVIPTEKNKKYKKTVEAVYHGKVPADVMNEFVENYVNKTQKVVTTQPTTNKNIVYDTHNTNLETYRSFVENVHKVPTSILNKFIENYTEEKKFFKGTTHVTAGPETNIIPQWLVKDENIKNKSYKKSVDAIYNGRITTDEVNNFADNYNLNKSSKKINSDISKTINDNLKKDSLINIQQQRAGDYHELINKITTDNFTTSDVIKKIVSEVTGTDKHFSLIDKVVNENKSLTDVHSLVKKVFSEIADKYSKESIFRASSKAINENVSNVINKAVSEITGSEKYSKVVDSVLSEKGTKTDNNFINDVISEVIGKRHVFLSDVTDKVYSENSNIKKFEIEKRVANKINNLSTDKIDKVFNAVNKSQNYSTVVDKIFTDNKDLVENKNVSEIISKVKSEVNADHSSKNKSLKHSDVVDRVLSESKNKELVETKNINEIVSKVKSEATSANNAVTSKESYNITKLVSSKLDDLGVSKYSNIVDKVLTENKHLSEDKNIYDIAHKVINETSDLKSKVSTENLKSYLNKGVNNFKDDKVFSEVKNIVSAVNNRLDKSENITENKGLSESVKKVVTQKLDNIEIGKYSNAVDKVLTENKDLAESKNITEIINKTFSKQDNISTDMINAFFRNDLKDTAAYHKIDTVNKIVKEKLSNETYNNFVNNVSAIPVKTIDKLIKTYDEKHLVNNFIERKFFKGTKDLQGPAGIDQIPVLATRGEAIIPVYKNNLYKPVINAVFEGSVPAEHLNNFVNNYHSIKHVPQPNYERIKVAAELKTGQDGRMSVAISEQNKLIIENNDLQRQTLRAMKNMAVSANIDRNGVAIMVNEYMKQIEIDKKL